MEIKLRFTGDAHYRAYFCYLFENFILGFVKIFRVLCVRIVEETIFYRFVGLGFPLSFYFAK